MTCSRCHQQDHKSFQRKQVQKDKKMDGNKRNVNPTIKASIMYTKHNYSNKTKCNNHILEQEGEK